MFDEFLLYDFALGWQYLRGFVTWRWSLGLQNGSRGSHGMGEDVASVSRLLVLLMPSYAFASRLGIHNTNCNSHLVRSIDPYNIWLY